MPRHFEWNETKNRTNLQKHGFDFADAAEMFRGALLTRLDLRKDYGETRWIGIGTIRGIIAVVVFTERDQRNIRIIISEKGRS
jgi:uncharacterized DUF497 family protein